MKLNPSFACGGTFRFLSLARCLLLLFLLHVSPGGVEVSDVLFAQPLRPGARGRGTFLAKRLRRPSGRRRTHLQTLARAPDLLQLRSPLGTALLLLRFLELLSRARGGRGRRHGRRRDGHRQCRPDGGGAIPTVAAATPVPAPPRRPRPRHRRRGQARRRPWPRRRRWRWSRHRYLTLCLLHFGRSVHSGRLLTWRLSHILVLLQDLCQHSLTVRQLPRQRRHWKRPHVGPRWKRRRNSGPLRPPRGLALHLFLLGFFALSRSPFVLRGPAAFVPPDGLLLSPAAVFRRERRLTGR